MTTLDATSDVEQEATARETRAQASPQTGRPVEANACAQVNTSRGSVVHYFAKKLASLAPTGTSDGLPIAIAFVLLTIVPLLLSATVEFPWAVLETPAGNVKLPLLRDFNVLFMFFVTLPFIAHYLATDEACLHEALSTVAKAGQMQQGGDAGSKFDAHWRHRFSHINFAAQAIGLAVGTVVAYLNYLAFKNPAVGHWAVGKDGFSVTGYTYLFTLAVFYAVIGIYVVRCISIAKFLNEMIGANKITVAVLHPDNCGGLRSIGAIGLRNQYILSVVGLNLLLLFYIYPRALMLPDVALGLIFAAAVAYVLIGPLIFLGPLVPFRRLMQAGKDELLVLLVRHIEAEIHKIRSDETVTAENEENINRLRRIGEAIEQYPVWPFDNRTLRKFVAAYAVPITTSLAVPAFGELLKRIIH